MWPQDRGRGGGWTQGWGWRFADPELLGGRWSAITNLSALAERPLGFQGFWGDMGGDPQSRLPGQVVSGCPLLQGGEDDFGGANHSNHRGTPTHPPKPLRAIG